MIQPIDDIVKKLSSEPFNIQRSSQTFDKTMDAVLKNLPAQKPAKVVHEEKILSLVYDSTLNS